MKSIISPALIFISLLSASITPALAQSTSSAVTTPKSELVAGSYANQNLRQDTAAALVEHGYIKPLDDITPFIIDQPTGPAGKKTWRELWVTSPDHSPAYFAITFTEDGNGSADFAISAIYDVDKVSQ